MQNLFPQLQGVLTGDLSGNITQTSRKTPSSRATRYPISPQHPVKIQGSCPGQKTSISMLMRMEEA